LPLDRDEGFLERVARQFRQAGPYVASVTNKFPFNQALDFPAIFRLEPAALDQQTRKRDVFALGPLLTRLHELLTRNELRLQGQKAVEKVLVGRSTRVVHEG